MADERKISIYIYSVLVVAHSGMQLPFLSFMKGNNQTILAIFLLIAGFALFYKRKRLASHRLGMKLFWLLVVSLAISIIMAYHTWGQSITTSLLLYRIHIWIMFIPLLLYIKPSLNSISDALYAFTITALLVWVGQQIGVIPIEFRESIWGRTLDESDEFGGYGIIGARVITFSLYIFLFEMANNFTKTNIIKVVLTLIGVILTTQRAMMFFALPITAYTFLFKINISRNKKVAIGFIFLFFAAIFFTNTIEIWQMLIEETSEQMGDKDYNRWLAVDYFLYKYNSGILTSIFGNGCLSLHNAGGMLIHNLGYIGIFIDDIGIGCVWVRYGIIPIILLYYIIIKTLKSKQMPLYMKYACIHIGLLPTAWTLIGHHWFVLIFIIYLFCLNLSNERIKRQSYNI